MIQCVANNKYKLLNITDNVDNVEMYFPEEIDNLYYRRYGRRRGMYPTYSSEGICIELGCDACCCCLDCLI